MTLTDRQVRLIEETLNKGDRVELIPLRDEIKVIKIQRKQVK